MDALYIVLALAVLLLTWGLAIFFERL